MRRKGEGEKEDGGGMLIPTKPYHGKSIIIIVVIKRTNVTSMKNVIV